MARKRHLLFRSVDAALRRNIKRHWRILRWFIVSLFTTVWVVFSSTSSLSCPEFSSQAEYDPTGHSKRAGQPTCLAAAVSSVPAQSSDPQQLVERGKARYEAGQLNQAISLLQQAVQAYQTEGDQQGAAIALRNLALVYQQRGDWAEARAAIQQSWALLNSQTSIPLEPLAQTLELQGEMQLTAGEPEAALDTWEQAAGYYAQLNDLVGMGRTTIRQAEALQTLGLYQRATERLQQLLPQLHQPDSILLSVALRHLGDAMRLSGQFDSAYTVLKQSLAIAERLNDAEAQTATLMSWGNVDAAQSDYLGASTNYQKAAERATTALSRVQAKLNLADAYFEFRFDQSRMLLAELPDALDQLPLSRGSLYANLNYTEQWLRLVQRDTEPGLPSPAAVLPIAQRLMMIQQQANQLSDRKAESFALGQLGALYEQAKQWPEAKQLTEKALNLSEQLKANEVSYRWEWQLGRILQAEGKQTEAITAYTNAISTLQLLRSDLVGINADLQVSFRKNAEPIHRELVSLLLDHEADGVPSPSRLEQARQTIESLQLAELENFFRAACLNAQPVQLDLLDPQAAVLYPILLPDRLEVILSLPQQPLLHQTIPVSQTDVIQMANQLNSSLQQPDNPQVADQAVALGVTLYDWLIRPLQDDLDRSVVKTIVFVQDGVLRNIPMAVLHDGQQYLIENYNLALAPGLQLLPSGNSQRERLDVLMLGLTEPRQNFRELPAVEQELNTIQAVVGNRGKILLNQDFTLPNLEAALDARPAPIIHLATHAQAGGNLETTFILTWDGEIQINQLSTLLQTANLNRRQPIELLVLSACQTAVGDDRAALGLAGIAVRAGARSTMATLWPVSDAAMAQLMGKFYENLAQPSATKAEALRQAQLALLQNPAYRHPFYWSSVILLGNWA